MKIENAVKFFRILFAFIFGATLMVYAGYGWHVEWLNDWQAIVAGLIGFTFAFLPHKMEEVVSKGLFKVFNLAVGKFFGSGGKGKASLIALLLLSSFTVNAQFYNMEEGRFVDNNPDSTIIPGVGQIRYDALTGKFRFGNGTTWYSFLKVGDVTSSSSSGPVGTIQTSNGAGGFSGLNLSVGTNSLYNRVAGQNWHLGWNASGTGGNADSRRLTIGAVGIAIGPFLTDPLTSLHVEKTISSGGATGTTGEALRLRSTYNAITATVGSGVGMSFESETADDNYEVGAIIEAVTTDVTSTSEDFDLVFKTMSNGAPAAEVFRIKSAGSVRINAPNDSEPALEFTDGESTVAGEYWQIYKEISDQSLRFYNGQDRFYFSADGRMGIGEFPISSSHQLNVTSGGAANIRVNTTGNFQSGISLQRTGTTPTKWELYVPPGSTDVRLYNTADKFLFSTSGVGTATDWVATSDRRIKENIVDAGSQLVKIKTIAALTRNYDRKDNGKNETGFIAQELYEVAPEYVSKGNDSTMWAVNYSKMVVPLYKAVAELTAEVERLKKELNRLKK